MSDINHVLSSSANYTRAFEDGLTTILQHRSAGTFILACANLFQHPEFMQSNMVLLREVFAHIKEHYRACQLKSFQPDDSPDDIAVMNKLIEIGLDNLDDIEYRIIDIGDADFLLNYNQLRSFRPARMSKIVNTLLDMPFQEGGFHFDKPFLKKEIFAEGEIEGKQLCLLYNKFPFIHYHALLVVDKETHRNQYLTLVDLEYIASLQTQTQRQCPDFVIAYNSLCAGASVNHLHFHTYLEKSALPIFSKQFIHNGGNQPYPASCLVFDSPEQAWRSIYKLHDNNIPYNLLLKNEHIYCLPRKKPDNLISEFDLSTFGWSHMAGLINVDNKQLLTEVSADLTELAIKSVSL